MIVVVGHILHPYLYPCTQTSVYPYSHPPILVPLPYLVGLAGPEGRVDGRSYPMTYRPLYLYLGLCPSLDLYRGREEDSDVVESLCTVYHDTVKVSGACSRDAAQGHKAD